MAFQANPFLKNKRLPFNAWMMLFLCSCAGHKNQNNTEAAISVYQPRQSWTQSLFSSKPVLVGGCFDVLHSGHIEFLKKSKAAGDFLIVALEPDEKIIHFKKRMPIHTQKERALTLAALRYVDHVLVLPYLKGFDEYNQLVVDIHPKILAVTADDPCMDKKQIQAKNSDAKLVIVTDKIKNFSSTHICTSSLKPNLFFEGLVIQGKKMARELGCPTANIQIDGQGLHQGIYSSHILIETHLYQGMSYYDKKRPKILEVHIFDYSGQLYGKKIKVILKNLMRKPVKNVPFHELKKLINQDVIKCRNDLK